MLENVAFKLLTCGTAKVNRITQTKQAIENN